MLKVSKLLSATLKNIDRNTKRTLDSFIDTITYSKSIPMDQIQEILVGGGYTLLQDDNTPWSGMISCPTEQNVRFSIPIGKLTTSEPEANTAYPETGAFLVMSLYRLQSGNIEITAYLT